MSGKREPRAGASERGPRVGPETAEQIQPSSLREFLLYFLRLGTFGFGGPIALAGHMHATVGLVVKAVASR